MRQFQANPGTGSNQSLTTATGLDGAYALAHVPPGEYVVDVQAPGYLSALDGVFIDPNGKSAQSGAEAALRKSGALVTIGDNGAARKDIDLVRGAAFTGRVTYADGQPASQTKVLLQKVDDTSSKDPKLVDSGQLFKLLFQQQQPRTDDQVISASPASRPESIVSPSSNSHPAPASWTI